MAVRGSSVRFTSTGAGVSVTIYRFEEGMPLAHRLRLVCFTLKNGVSNFSQFARLVRLKP